MAMLQASALPSFMPGGIAPDLMLLLVVSWSLLRGARASIPLALAGGLLLDLLSGGPFGAATIALLVAGVIIGLEELNLFRDSFWLPPLAGGLATVIYDGAFLVVLLLSGRPLQPVQTLLQVVLSAVLLNAVLMYPVFWAMRAVHRRTLPIG